MAMRSSACLRPATLQAIERTRGRTGAGVVTEQRGDGRGEVGGIGGHDPYLPGQSENESIHICIEGDVGKWFIRL